MPAALSAPVTPSPPRTLSEDRYYVKIHGQEHWNHLQRFFIDCGLRWYSGRWVSMPHTWLVPNGNMLSYSSHGHEGLGHIRIVLPGCFKFLETKRVL